MESVVGMRGLFMCRIARLFLLQRLKRNILGDALYFYNIKNLGVIIFFSCTQGPEGNLRHSERNFRETCTISSMWPALPGFFGKDNWVDLKLEGDVSAAPFGDGGKKGI